MRPRGRKIAVISAVVFLLNLQRIVDEITLRNLMFLRERMIEDFSQESENLLFLTCLLTRTRQQNWFDALLASHQLGILWKPNFRMERKTFEELSRIFRGDLMKQETRMRKPVSLEKRIAVGLWRLSTGNSYCSCGLQFGLGKSTAKVICQEFEEALCRKKDLFIPFPYMADEVQAVMNDFEEEYHFPQIVGAVDGCHIEINAPPENKEDYFNRKQYYSINVQGIVNPQLHFQHIAVGFPGSIHDSRVLRLSRIFNLAENEEILTAPTRMVNRVQLRPMLVGDSAYPLKNWLLKPFSNRGHLSHQKKRFNAKLSTMRSVVERAFSMLKGLWRALLKKIEQDHTSVQRTVTAACVLHNFCLLHGDTFDDENWPPPDDPDDDDDDDPIDGASTRQALLDFLVTQGFL